MTQRVRVFLSLLVWGMASISTFASVFNWSLVGDEATAIPGEWARIYGYPIYQPSATWRATILTAGTLAVDRYTTPFVQDVVYPLTTELKETDPDTALFVGAGALYTWGALTAESLHQETALRLVKAYMHSYLYTQLTLKTIFARNRPTPYLSSGEVLSGYTNDPLSFGNYHSVYFEDRVEGSSFPSFQFTFVFAAIRVLSHQYQNPWSYTLGAVYLLPNISRHQHWVSDMVAGAFIGTMIAEEIVNPSKVDGPSDDEIITMIPLVSVGTVGGLLHVSI